MSVRPSGGEKQITERVVLPGLELEVSRLGFGTSALMSRVNRRDSVRLLETALEEGITHFDTARSYGFGEAELAVGDVLQGRRDRITVTTKIGILPPRRSSVLSIGKAGARGLLAVAPRMRALVRRRAGSLVEASRFDVESMTKSLEESLRQLRTDYVDLLLLHEPSCEVLATAEPLAFLQQAQREGKVRHFGVAADVEVIAYALQHAPEYARVLQLPNSAATPNLRRLPVRSDGTFITHSGFGSWLERLQHRLWKEREMSAGWSQELELDVTKPSWLPRLALQWCLADVPAGIVLFTSTKPAHIRENAAALRTAASPGQLKRFEQLVQERLVIAGW